MGQIQLLATIIGSLLIVVSIRGLYFPQGKKSKNSKEAKKKVEKAEGEVGEARREAYGGGLENFMVISLFLGVCSLFILFLTYIIEDFFWKQISLFISYFFSLSFVLFIFKIVIEGWEKFRFKFDEVWSHQKTMIMLISILLLFILFYLIKLWL